MLLNPQEGKSSSLLNGLQMRVARPLRTAIRRGFFLINHFRDLTKMVNRILGGGLLAALRQIAKKLQTALCQKGRYVKINQRQSYSEKSKKMLTKYILQENCEENGKQRTVTHLESYQMADVVKKLAELYGEIGGDKS